MPRWLRNASLCKATGKREHVGRTTTHAGPQVSDLADDLEEGCGAGDGSGVNAGRGGDAAEPMSSACGPRHTAPASPGPRATDLSHPGSLTPRTEIASREGSRVIQPRNEPPHVKMRKGAPLHLPS